MTVFRSKPAEVEAMQWATDVVGVTRGDWLPQRAEQIAAWVNTNGGEARYEPEHRDRRLRDPIAARIAVRTISGEAFAAPGDYVVMETFASLRPSFWIDKNPATFEQRWEPVS